MTKPLALTLGQQFELERMNRALDATVDLDRLRDMAKQLLQAWHSQKAATMWVMRQQLGASSSLDPEALASVMASRPEDYGDVL
ncbi:MAG: hypothetical protein ACKOCM_08220 [Cyanobacteriota bacterium]